MELGVMAFCGAFTNSSMAMMAQSHCMDVIGQNIANINTDGYKKVDDRFQTNLSEVIAGGNTKIFGVKTATRQMVDVQGSVRATGQTYDLAINGRGFFVLNTAYDGSGDTYFTRDGSFQQVGQVDPDTGATTGTASYLGTKGGLYVMGWSADADTGAITTTTTTTDMSGIRTDLFNQSDGNPTSTIDVQANINSEATEAQVLGLPVHIQTTDSSGNTTYTSQNLSMIWTPTGAPNTWSVTFSVDSTVGTVTAPATATTVTFNPDGSLDSTTADLAVTIDWTNATYTDSSITIDYALSQQLAGETDLRSLQQNGRPLGYLSSTRFDSEGHLVGTFTNGHVKNLAQVPTASFVAPNNLNPISQTLFTVTDEAGEMTINDLSTSRMASFVPGAVESSNVDLADEFTKMIVTQKAYTMASTVFKTADEMTMTARDLKG